MRLYIWISSKVAVADMAPCISAKSLSDKGVVQSGKASELRSSVDRECCKSD
jgi:hypothetical protein